LAQKSIQFLIQGIPASLLVAVRWPGLEAGQLLSIYDIVPRLKCMVFYLQSYTCHGVALNKTQGHSFVIIIYQIKIHVSWKINIRPVRPIDIVFS
jgi:hypothetical protein